MVVLCAEVIRSSAELAVLNKLGFSSRRENEILFFKEQKKERETRERESITGIGVFVVALWILVYFNWVNFSDERLSADVTECSAHDAKAQGE